MTNGNDSAGFSLEPNEAGYGDCLVVHATDNAKYFFPFQRGLTKREYFAAMAMQGICANGDLSAYFAKHKVKTEDLIPMYAEGAVKQADALIKTLNESDETKNNGI